MNNVDLDNNTIGWVILFICLILMISAWLGVYYTWIDNQQIKYFCEDCEYKEDEFICQNCGTHKYEKELY